MFTILYGDARKKLLEIDQESIDLIVTSPPYADARKSCYQSVNADCYVEWFMPIAEELSRVLKPTGSFVLVIKERVIDGERHPYVMQLILEMRNRGWRFVEEYIWHKRNSYPGHWPNRFRDAWERCIHFTKEKRFSMYQENVRVPVGDWAKNRLKSLSETDQGRDSSKVGNNFGKTVKNWVGRGLCQSDKRFTFANRMRESRASRCVP